MIGRRGFISLLGGGVVLAAGAGVWTATRDPAMARAAWELAGAGYDDPRMRWLSWAVLAPNPHNRQPWLADLTTEGEISLRVDLDRRLPHTDPFDRQITIGLGAFLELARMAAAEDGVALEIEAFPEGAEDASLDLRPIARLRVIDGTASPDPLFAHARDRRTNRAAFNMGRPVPDAALAAMSAAAFPLPADMTTETARVERLRDIAWRAMVTEMTTTATAMESVNLTRIGRAEIEANPDGISLAGPLMEGLGLAGLLSRDSMADPDSSGFRAMMDAMKPTFDTAMGFFWIGTMGNDRFAQIAAGRAYLRANLAATSQGLAVQPFSQALQEFPEMRASYNELAQALAAPEGMRVQMFVRVGFAPAPKGSPRWPLSSRVVAA